MFILLALLSPFASAQENCAITNSVSDLNGVIAQAESAFTALAVDDFHAKVDEIAMMLPCASGALTPSAAAQVHVVQGLQQFSRGEEQRAEWALTAARRIEPDAKLADGLVPRGHPIRKLHEGATLEAKTETVPPPAEGKLLFDGRVGTERPTDQASLVQLIGADGVPITSVYAFPGDKLPRYVAAEAPPPPTSNGGPPVAGIVGGVLLAAGTGSLLIASGHRSKILNAEDSDVMQAYWPKNKAYGYAGYGLVTLGLAGVGVQFAL